MEWLEDHMLCRCSSWMTEKAVPSLRWCAFVHMPLQDTHWTCQNSAHIDCRMNMDDNNSGSSADGIGAFDGRKARTRVLGMIISL